MSKRALKKYLSELDKAQLSDQIIDLYDRFKEVKTYYDFAFNPKEDRLLAEFKTRVRREYFPENGRKAKARPSIAQKRIKKFIRLEVNPETIIEAMLYTIETAQAFSAKRQNCRDPFFRSMFNSFKQAIQFAHYHGFIDIYFPRFHAIVAHCISREWPNKNAFIELYELETDKNFKQ